MQAVSGRRREGVASAASTARLAEAVVGKAEGKFLKAGARLKPKGPSRTKNTAG